MRESKKRGPSAHPPPLAPGRQDLRISLEAEIFQDIHAHVRKSHSRQTDHKSELKHDLHVRHAIAESQFEDWDLYIQDEGDEDYDGQLQNYSSERMNTEEIRKELHLNVRPSFVDEAEDRTSLTTTFTSMKTATNPVFPEIEESHATSSSPIPDGFSWSTTETAETAILKEFDEKQGQGKVFGPSEWQKRREKEMNHHLDGRCVTDEERCSVNDAMPYGGIKFRPIHPPPSAEREGHRRRCAVFLFALGFCFCCATPCCFALWTTNHFQLRHGTPCPSQDSRHVFHDQCPRLLIDDAVSFLRCMRRRRNRKQLETEQNRGQKWKNAKNNRL